MADARFGWEICSPLQGAVVASAAGGKLAAPAASFLSVDQPGVVITDVKQADFGIGHIVKFQEVAHAATPAVGLHTGALAFYRIKETTPLESDVRTLLDPLVTGGTGQRDFTFAMGAGETKTLRVEYTGSLPPSRVADWAMY